MTNRINNNISGSVSEANGYLPRWLLSFRVQALLILALVTCMYANTFHNSYAMDDTLVIVKNEYVLQGVSGIPDLLTHDSYDSYYRRFNTQNPLSGGRYRPLSLITFAIEQQLLGPIPADRIEQVIQHAGEPTEDEAKTVQDMRLRHAINIALYALCCIVALLLLRTVVFPYSPAMAFFSVLIFAIHPIHTEVVANVKSRDEILSLLFICATLLFAFRYQHSRRPLALAGALGSYFLALMSKEYGLALLGILPLSLWLFCALPLGRVVRATGPFLVVAVIYLFLRFSVSDVAGSVSDSSIINNPYLLATGMQSVATRIATSFTYFRLLLYPHPLSVDYGYNQLPYTTFANPLVWLSICVHIGIVVATIYFAIRRHWLAFALAFFLVHLLLINNFFFNIGAPLGERLIFHSSLGGVMLVAWALIKVAGNVGGKGQSTILWSAMIALVAMSAIKTTARNADWKDDETLFAQALKVSPNSILVNNNVAWALMKKAIAENDTSTKTKMLTQAVGLLHKATKIYPDYSSAYINAAIAYLYLAQPDRAIANLQQAKRLYPTHPRLPELFYSAGAIYYQRQQGQQAADAWQTTLQLQPAFAPAREALDALMGRR